MSRSGGWSLSQTSFLSFPVQMSKNPQNPRFSEKSGYLKLLSLCWPPLKNGCGRAGQVGLVAFFSDKSRLILTLANNCIHFFLGK